MGTQEARGGEELAGNVGHVDEGKDLQGPVPWRPRGICSLSLAGAPVAVGLASG